MRDSRKTSSSVRADARYSPSTLRHDLSEIGNLPSRQAINRLLEANFTKAGFDRGQFAQLLKQSDAEVRQIMAEFLTEADRDSPARLEALRATVEDLRNRSRQLEKLTPLDAPAQFVFLDTATEIVGPPEMGVSSEHIEPWQNSFEFEWDVSGDDEAGFSRGAGAVGFRFLWQNPSNNVAMINSVDGFLALHGDCIVRSDGGFLPGDRFSNAQINARLFIEELWNDPPTSPPEEADQTVLALTIGCSSRGFVDPGAIDALSLSKTLIVSFSGTPVPPKATIRFSVACECDFQFEEGGAQFLFRGSGRQVMCPAVRISVTS